METAAEPTYMRDLADRMRRTLSSGFDPNAPGHNVQVTLPLCNTGSAYRSLSQDIGDRLPDMAGARLCHGQLEVKSSSGLDRLIAVFEHLFELIRDIVASSAFANRFDLDTIRIALNKDWSGTHTLTASLERN